MLKTTYDQRVQLKSFINITTVQILILAVEVQLTVSVDLNFKNKKNHA